MGIRDMDEVPATFLWLAGLGICAVVLWDTYCATTGQEQYEVSHLLFLWSVRWPALPFAAGFLAGHLFWRK